MKPPTIDFYMGVDNVPVVHIDTPDDWDENKSGPVCRVYLNDDTDSPLFANPALAGIVPATGRG